LFVFDQIVKTAPLHCLLLPLFFVLLDHGKTAPQHWLPERSFSLPIRVSGCRGQHTAGELKS